MTNASPIRRLLVAAGLLVAVLVACGREITGPASAPVNLFHRAGALLFTPQVETAVPAEVRTAALQQVAFERVRITLRREDGSIALDTVVTFPAGANELTLTLQVPLPASAPAGGVPLNLNLGYVNAVGDTVFKGGPTPVVVVPTTPGSPAPAPVQVPVQYSGPGANATSVVIAPKTASGQPGQGVNFTAQALNAAGQAIPNTPVVFTSSNPAVVTVNPTTGVAAFEGRGTATVVAQLLTGPNDVATVTVTLPAARLALVSGADQVGLAGATLGSPIVAKVQASDGVGVGGVTVTFAASGGGTATPASAVSGSDGSVSTVWRLGPAAGPQVLTVTSAGLAGSPLPVNATARAVTPTRLVIGTHPTNGVAGATLNPITVAAQDADGNVVTPFTGDVSVALGANPGSAALSGTATVKAVAGVATFSDLKLNRPGTGYTLVFNSAPLAAATSNAFNITAGTAEQLAFTGVPTAVEAGVASTQPVTVAVQDAAGNTVTSFTGAVTLAIDPSASPAGAALTGTLTRSAVAGVATFTDVTFTRAGLTTLTASAANLRGATSTGFTVRPGAPASLEVVAGDGQKAAAGTQLSEISVRLADALNNSIPEAAIAFAVTSGGGSLNTASARTDASGTARVLWTIGAGPQTMTASHGGLSTVVTATSTSVALTWTGATSTAWNTASNWSPAFVPSAADAVTIPVTANAPVIGAPASVLSLTLASGATLTNNSTLQVGGNLDAGTTISGSGSVMLVGASGTLKGVINQAVAVTGAAYTLTGNTTVNGALTMSSSGKLTVGGRKLVVNGSLSTSGSGRLAMANTADSVMVSGDVTFAGGSEFGFLTAGLLHGSGNFTATGSTFSAGGSHVLKMAGTASPQTLAYSAPVTGQGINQLIFEGGAAKVVSGAVQVMGDVTIDASSAPVTGAATVKIGGNFSDATVFPDSGGNPDPQGGWRVATTHFTGTNTLINSTFITSNVTIGSTVRLAPCTSCVTETALMAGLLATDGYVQVNGDVTVAGTGAVLKLNGNHLRVTGNFATASGGSLDMTDANDYLQVEGSAMFGGGSTAGKLTLGTLDVIQDFTQSGSADSFAPSATFTTYLGDDYYGEDLRASRANRARAAEGAPLSSSVGAARARQSQRAQAVRAKRAAGRARLDRRAAAYARLGMAAPSREQRATPRSVAAGETYRLLRPRREYSGTSAITFANPTSSFFGTLYLSGPEFVLASDVLVKGELETGYSYYHAVSSSSATPRKITSHGADVSDLDFNNVQWVLLDGSEVWALDWVTFDNMDPTADQFTVARTSDELGLCDCSPYYQLYYWTFYTTPTTGHYIKAGDTNGGPNVLELYMVSPDPSAHGGKVSTAGGALISNWPETSAITWLGGTSNDWNVGSNWSGGVVPTSSDDVLIPGGTTNKPYTNTGPGYAHHLTIESGAYVQTSCSYELYVYGNVSAPLAAAGVRTCEGDALHLMGDGTPGGNTVAGRFEVLSVEGAYTLPGSGTQLIADYELKIASGGDLKVNSGRVETQNLYTVSGGTLTMTGSLDEVYVNNDAANFTGGTSTLTAGTLYITDAYLYATGSAYAAGGTQKTVFVGSNSVTFTDPAQSFLRDAQVSGGGTLFLGSDLLVTRTLSRGYMALGVISVTTDAYPSPSRLLTVSGLEQSDTDPMQFNNVRLNLTGSSSVSFTNGAFVGFGPGFAGDAVLEVNRSSTYGAVTFTGLNFSSVGFAADTTRHYVKNSGSANITLAGATPSPGIASIHFIATGVGTVTWP